MPNNLITNRINNNQKIANKKRSRKSIRLKDHDYAGQGMYFVTVCVKDRKCLLGEVMDKKMRLNNNGKIVEQWWQKISEHFPCVKLAEYIIMPNHVHGIIEITDDVGAGFPRPKRSPRPMGSYCTNKNITPTLGEMVAYFKYGSTKRINNLRKTPGVRLWQRNYHDHIIRNDTDLGRILEYIVNNLVTWEMNENFNE
jgi:putative transposase